MGHLDSQRSLPVFDPAAAGLSSLAKKARLKPEHGATVLFFVRKQDELRALGATDLPAAPWWTQRDVLGS